MKIVILAYWFSEKMGYAENYLPVAFGKLGHETHLVTTDLQIYATSPDYDKVYLQHLGPKQVSKGVFKKEHYTLHRNGHYENDGLGIDALEQKIAEIKPDVVYCFEIVGPDINLLVKIKEKYNFKLVSESRLHLSVFNVPKTLRQKFYIWRKSFHYKEIAQKVDLFYPIAPDVLQVIQNYYRIPKRKCKLASLAVDTDLFNDLNLNESEKQKFRKQKGFNETDIVCVYTGRFTHAKGPLILAKAIDYLHSKGETAYKGFFVGQGDLQTQSELTHHKGCSTHPFVNGNELPMFYKAFDIGVWPLQESTSQLDAAACGMPIIINSTVEDKFRIEGNGLAFEINNYHDLADKIVSLKSAEVRKKLGSNGSQKIKKAYSWDFLAKTKIDDFKSL
ncbi:MAG TPA: glycosyltransferase family 4 protein [Bacteroidia bacterium]|nr:glycosyltransferase family 4 protein [Bacteroidia bacterium]